MLKKVLGNNQVIWFCLISVLFFVCNTDVHAQNEKEQSILDTFGHEKNVLDGLFSENPELARLLSPVEYLTKTSPPILLLHGDKDPTLSIKNSLHVMDVAKAKGADVQLLTVNNAGHSFHGKKISPSLQEVNEASAKFMISRLTGKE